MIKSRENLTITLVKSFIVVFMQKRIMITLFYSLDSDRLHHYNDGIVLRKWLQMKKSIQFFMKNNQFLNFLKKEYMNSKDEFLVSI